MLIRSTRTSQIMVQRRRQHKYLKVGEVDESMKELTALMAKLSIREEIRPLDWLTDTEDILMEDLSLQNSPRSKRSRAVDSESPEAQRRRPNKRKLDTVAAVHGNGPDRKRRKLSLDANKERHSVSAETFRGSNFIFTVPQDRETQKKDWDWLTNTVTPSTALPKWRGRHREGREKRRGGVDGVLADGGHCSTTGGTDRLVITATPAGRHAQKEPRRERNHI